MSTLETEQPELETLIHQIKTGELQLPLVQRDWVWDYKNVRSLLSVLQAHFQLVQSCF